MAREARIHVTVHNLTDAEYKKLLAALESVGDAIKITTDAPILTQTENEKWLAKRQLEGTADE